MPARSLAAPLQSGVRSRRRLADRSPCLSVRTEPLESRVLLSLAPVGDVFRVNADATGSHTAADVAMDADGDFVVAWQRSAGPGANTAQGFARAFDRLGGAKFADILVT